MCGSSYRKIENNGDINITAVSFHNIRDNTQQEQITTRRPTPTILQINAQAKL